MSDSNHAILRQWLSPKYSDYQPGFLNHETARGAESVCIYLKFQSTRDNANYSSNIMTRPARLLTRQNEKLGPSMA